MAHYCHYSVHCVQLDITQCKCHAYHALPSVTDALSARMMRMELAVKSVSLAPNINTN
jgi:uncharacterized cysteine cluster protein YcgN (CxxCxxCC family)